jgi:hypothetical protein
MGRVGPELRPLVLLFKYDPTSIFFQIRETRRELIADSQPGYPLYHLLKLLCTDNDMHATEACDHIFALLGLSGDADDLGLRVEYALKKRIDLIFTRTTKSIIASANLDILTMAQHPKIRQESPSWVPNFTSKLNASFVDQATQDMDPFTLFNTSGGRTL